MQLMESDQPDQNPYGSHKHGNQSDSGGGWVFKNRLYGVHAFTSDKEYADNGPAGFMDVCGYKKVILCLRWMLPLPSQFAPLEIHRITHYEIYRDSNGRKHDIMLLRLPRLTTIQPISLAACPDTLL
ncbi:hypothetical protein CCH79_00018578, partial [Gambusia affinis]